MVSRRAVLTTGAASVVIGGLGGTWWATTAPAVSAREPWRSASAGLSFHPLSQALQEFPEMAEPYRRAHELLPSEEGQTVQMLARLGYGPEVGPSPRENLESKLMQV